MARPRPERKSEPETPTERRVLPMQLQVGERIVDETGEYEVIGRPYTTAGGKGARARVQRVGKPGVTEIRIWRAHERVSVKRATTEEASDDGARHARPSLREPPSMLKRGRCGRMALTTSCILVRRSQTHKEDEMNATINDIAEPHIWGEELELSNCAACGGLDYSFPRPAG
jgi:hypothetical protein